MPQVGRPLAEEPVIVLIPGAFSSGERLWFYGFNWAAPLFGGDAHFTTLQKALGQAGLRSLICPATPDQDKRNMEERAEECVSQILESRHKVRCDPGSRRDVMVLGYSMGGLIARLLARDERVSGCIHSVTSVSAPHRGTPIADFLLDRVSPAKTEFEEWRKWTETGVPDPGSSSYLGNLRHYREGNAVSLYWLQDLPDNADVRYYYISSSQKRVDAAPMEIGRRIVAESLESHGYAPEFQENDGVVPVFSQRHGEHVAHLNANHWAAVCVDPMRDNPQCEMSVKIIAGHLKNLHSRLR